jgi:hypothetical protein
MAAITKRGEERLAHRAAESTVLSLRLVERRAEPILVDLVAVVWQALLIQRGRVLVALLRPIGWPIAFHRAFVLSWSHI